MDFSALVLMEVDKEEKTFKKEIGSYNVNDGAEFITKMYYDGEKVFVFFDTKMDVEDWQYAACYDLINEDVFTKNGFEISDIDDEFNPTWLVKFDFIEDHDEMGEKINCLCTFIKDEMNRVFSDMEGKKEEYI